MVIEKKIDINNSIQNVWKVLGHEFAHPYRWASSVNHSEGHGKQVATTHCDERSCQTVMGNIRERLLDYSDEHHCLAYEIIEGLPGAVKKATNTWQLTEIAGGKTKLTMKMELTFQGLVGNLMQPLMRNKLTKVAEALVEDFAHYAESGQPHPRKVAAQEKLARQGQAAGANLLPVFLGLFALGTLIPVYFIHLFVEANGWNVPLFLTEVFANNASATFGSDLLICAVAFWAFIIYDKRGKPIPHILIFVAVNVLIGLSSALPLYLYFRQKAIANLKQ
jgi:hypothetical protein